MSKKIMIIAGEASGDLHGGKLVKALRERDAGAEIFGVGGDHMAEAGMELFYHVRDLAYIGFSEIVKHLPHFYNVFQKLVEIAVQRQPDVVVLIDYPGFNLRFGKKLKSLGFRIFYFIAPQVWAWRQSRAKKMASFIDRMAVIFDFEVDFFQKYGIDTHFVGHPLVDSLRLQTPRDEFFEKFDLDAEQPILALFPGSRKQEIENLLPDMLATAQQLLQKFPKLQIAVGLAETIPLEFAQAFIAEKSGPLIVEGATYELMSYANAAIVASGTATLEVAYFQLPFILMYRVSSFSFFLGKRLVKIPHIGLVNIVGGEEIAREYIQEKIVPAVMAAELERCLFDEKFRYEKISKLSIVKQKLGERGAAKKTADLIYEMI